MTTSTNGKTATMRSLRAGVVGLGWAGRTHAESLQAIPGVEVAAIAGKEPERAAEVAARLNIPAVYDDWHDMIAAGGLDIVTIAAPNALHLPIARAAFEAGAHVLCEKPLAATSAQAAEVVRLADEHGRVLHTVFNYRHRGDVSVLKGIIDSGELGDIYYGKVSWMRRRHYDVSGWFGVKEQSGGGPLIDLGVHMLDLGLHLMGEPQVDRVSGATFAELTPKWLGDQGRDAEAWEVEDLAVGLIHMRSGATLALDVSWAAHGPYADDDMQITLHGTKGGAHLRVADYQVAGELRTFGERLGELTETKLTVPPSHGHDFVVRDFVQAIRTGTPVGDTGREGLLRSQVLDALYLSAETHADVAVVESAGDRA